MITQEYLKTALFYNKDTGDFLWRYRGDVGDNINRAFSYKPAGFVKQGYLQIHVNKKTYMAHKLAWLFVHGEMPVMIDHINRNKSDNRISNLRKANNKQNQFNTGMWSTNTSGFKGVRKEKGRWRARIRDDGKLIHIGSFDTAEEASEAYQEAAKKLHGDFFAGVKS